MWQMDGVYSLQRLNFVVHMCCRLGGFVFVPGDSVSLQWTLGGGWMHQLHVFVWRRTLSQWTLPSPHLCKCECYWKTHTQKFFNGVSWLSEVFPWCSPINLQRISNYLTFLICVHTLAIFTEHILSLQTFCFLNHFRFIIFSHSQC